MPSRTHESPRLQQDHHRRPAGDPPVEPRNPHTAHPQNATAHTDAHAGFDENLNPIDDDHIDTRGSER